MIVRVTTILTAGPAYDSPDEACWPSIEEALASLLGGLDLESDSADPIELGNPGLTRSDSAPA